MRAGWVALLSLLFAGCGLNRELARKADAIVAAERPADTSCAAENHCAIDSPYRALIDEAKRATTPDTPVHYVNLLETGEDSLLLRVHLIRAAKTSIDIQTFIFAGDDAGWLILDELIAAARRGVRVRVLVDQLFSLDNVEWLSRIAETHANLEFRLYNPTFDEAVTQPLEFAAGIVCCFSQFNQRMHNKLFLVDGEIGIAGGRNIENRYFDWDQEFDYRDRDALVLGPVAGAEMQASFDEFWAHRRAVPLTRLNDVDRRIVADAGKPTAVEPPPNVDWPRLEALRARALDPAAIKSLFIDTALRVGRVEYFSDSPDKPEHPDTASQQALTEHIVQLLTGAEREVVFETPYLVLSDRARKIFRELYKRKPSVPVVVSTNSLAATDAFYVYALSHKYKKRYLKRYGFEIHEFKPFPGDAAEFVRNYDTLAGGGNMGAYERYGRAPLKRGGVRLGLHAKSLIIDGTVCMIGSHNFDPRSDNYNTESGFIIHDVTVSGRVRSAVLKNTEPENAWVIAKRVEQPNAVDDVNEAISDVSTALPLFDLWPFRYATSFELKAGCVPLKTYDPGFYACYRDVGDFPEVDLPMKTIYTRIVTAFGAGLVGIL
ncbi:MAG TPA: phospholipase D family protein [Rhodanobacteraceae bacterium]|nr:phospholipase D family protein [Rhodanobacteraceae bacterium]